MNIILYTGFEKKRNSTKQPTQQTISITKTGTLKEPCSVLNPVFKLKRDPLDSVPDLYNYAYIPKFGRFYFVTNVTWNEGFWEYQLAVDVLASYAADIGDSSHYILRTNSSTTNFDPMITDTMYPATNDIDLYQYAISSAFVSNISDGIYVVGIISGSHVGYPASQVGAISYYAMTATEFGDLKEALLSDENLVTMDITDAQGGMKITDLSKPLFKALYNPYQYIASCMWFPFPKSAIVSTPVQTIPIGWWDYTLSGNLITAQNVSIVEGPTTIHQHPQAATRGEYLNYAPYTRCSVYGIYGTIPLDLSFFDRDDDTLVLFYTIDLITGQCRVRIQSYQSSAAVIHHHNVSERDFLCGVPIQLAQIATDYLGASVAAIDATASTIQNALSLNIGGAISSAAHGIYNTLNAAMPQMSSSGTNGSFLITNQNLNTTFSYQHYKIVDEDIDHKGRPLCQIRTINTLSGYILCADGEFNISCLDEERTMISDFLTGGFFWE